MAAITAYGFGCAALLSGVLSGKPAFGPVTRFDVAQRRVGVAATLPGSPDLRELLDEVIGQVGAGGPVFLAAHQRMGIGDRTYTSACVAASTAVADAASTIAHGDAQRVVVAAGYLVDPVQFGLFDAGRALAVDGAVRPFSMGRKGLLLGDGVAAIVLEARPRREPMAWIDGWGRAGDAYHVCQPRPDGSGLARAIERALLKAGRPGLDYVNAHGSGSPQSDAAEAQALPRGVPVSSTKALHGQALEASPLIELVTTILAMNEGALPVNAGYLGPDPECPVDVILDEPHAGDIRHALVVNSAFGGANTALVVSAP
ncbi:beta-ketoacyl synthase N-terminal-like domain-containing protein [Allorhizocola rhizosphaerae]|uniref:beta-ketoacyl synthase N-terminal-like domain-containing protein n=1 Tax=Allorhizocola rhizosphaerae TaxID=1872709 RepID=UPI000E3CF471|nr:beta-ketoacyl synthase N-terminal-like domain-containing protein [Allorhizocola rhizosphaerae]